MTAVGELEKLILTHDQFISRGQVIEAVEIKKLIGPHLSERDRAARLYRTVNEKAEEFIECAESNFEKFQEIINYKLLAQLEYYYPEYFGALTRALRDSAEKNIEDEQWLYAGLLCASSRTVDADIILSVINYFLGKKQYKQLMLIFERLGETRTAVQDFLAQDGEKTDIPLLEETDRLESAGKRIFKAYSEETLRFESQSGGFAAAFDAYLLANILSVYLPEQELLSESSMVNTSIACFKELAQRTDIDNSDELVRFIENFKENPAITSFSRTNHDRFRNYLNSPDLRDILDNLVRNLLGKTRFEEVFKLSTAMNGLISFSLIFKEHLAQLKESRFFVQAIEMSETLQLKDELTDELKLEAFRKLMEDYTADSSRENMDRLKKFCIKHGINCAKYAQLTDQLRGTLEEMEKQNPDLVFDLNQLYTLFHLERKMTEYKEFSPLKLLEPIMFVFSWFFKLVIRFIMQVASSLTPHPGIETGNSSKIKK